MGFKDRIEKANEAARQAKAEGADERREQREKLKADWQASKEQRAGAKAKRQAQRTAKNTSKAQPTKLSDMGRQKISKVGDTSSGTLACPNCSGQQFTAKRSMFAKTVGVATIGVGAALAPKSQVKCVTCGTMYRRG